MQRRWRRIADSYDPPRVFVSEASSPGRLNFLTEDRLHTTFTFDSVFCAWDAASLRHMIDHNLRLHAAVGAATTWVMGNHDQTRPASRYGKRITGWDFPASGEVAEADRIWAEFLYPWPTDAVLGRRRARALALLYLALPGGMYVYQGEELGLDEVEDLPVRSLQDPAFWRSNGRTRGRDGCRVPLPWSGTAAPFGFGAGEPWLPQPAHWAGLTAEAQASDPASTLSLYREALAIRKRHPAFRSAGMRWVESGGHPEVLTFVRDPGLVVQVNCGRHLQPLPEDATIVMASALDDAGMLPPDAAVWWERPATLEAR